MQQIGHRNACGITGITMPTTCIRNAVAFGRTRAVHALKPVSECAACSACSYMLAAFHCGSSAHTYMLAAFHCGNSAHTYMQAQEAHIRSSKNWRKQVVYSGSACGRWAVGVRPHSQACPRGITCKGGYGWAVGGQLVGTQLVSVGGQAVGSWCPPPQPGLPPPCPHYPSYPTPLSPSAGGRDASHTTASPFSGFCVNVMLST